MDDNLITRLQAITRNIHHAQQSLRFLAHADNQQLHRDRVAKSLQEAEGIIERMITDDQESGAAHKRWLLRGRIRRMVERICREEKKKEWQIHRQWLELGGSPQDAMSVYELQRKVDWLYANWGSLFKRDTRDWEPPAPVTSMEPSLVRRANPDDID